MSTPDNESKYCYHHNDLVDIVSGKPLGDYWENNWWHLEGTPHVYGAPAPNGRPTPQSDSELKKLIDYVWSQATLNAVDSMSENRELAGNVKPKALRKIRKIIESEADRRAEKLVVEAKINHLQILANVYAQAMDLLSQNKSGYKEMYLARKDTLAEMTRLAALTPTKPNTKQPNEEES